MLADLLRMSLALAGTLAGAGVMFLLITRSVRKSRDRSHD